MEFLKKKINRRDFVQYLALGGASFIYGCSKDPASPNNPGNNNLDSQPTKIALHVTQDRAEGVRTVMELLDYPSMEGKKVILKPNFNTADPAPASTHNDTLSQLVTGIHNRGASGICLAERSYHPFDTVISDKGIDILAQNLGFDICNLNLDDYTVFNSESLHWSNGFRLPQTIADAEYIVTTCCLKTHFIGVITMSLKLAVGILPSLHMQELHSSPSINTMIAEINLAYKPDLIIMDGVDTFISGGPSSGTKVPGNVFVGGTDRIAVDAVGTAILKDLGSTSVSGKIFDLQQIRRAVQLHLGISGPDQIEFVTANQASQNYAAQLKNIIMQG
jgi:uncharacterized protein (DUF362 family)